MYNYTKIENSESFIVNCESAQLESTWRSGVEEIHPTHPMVKNWVFQDGEQAEALLVNAMAAVAGKNGMDANDLQHLFPAVLRMLKSKIRWAG